MEPQISNEMHFIFCTFPKCFGNGFKVLKISVLNLWASGQREERRQTRDVAVTAGGGQRSQPRPHQANHDQHLSPLPWLSSPLPLHHQHDPINRADAASSSTTPQPCIQSCLDQGLGLVSAA